VHNGPLFGCNQSHGNRDGPALVPQLLNCRGEEGQDWCTAALLLRGAAVQLHRGEQRPPRDNSAVRAQAAPECTRQQNRHRTCRPSFVKHIRHSGHSSPPAAAWPGQIHSTLVSPAAPLCRTCRQAVAQLAGTKMQGGTQASSRAGRAEVQRRHMAQVMWPVTERPK